MAYEQKLRSSGPLFDQQTREIKQQLSDATHALVCSDIDLFARVQSWFVYGVCSATEIVVVWICPNIFFKKKSYVLQESLEGEFDGKMHAMQLQIDQLQADLDDSAVKIRLCAHASFLLTLSFDG